MARYKMYDGMVVDTNKAGWLLLDEPPATKPTTPLGALVPERILAAACQAGLNEAELAARLHPVLDTLTLAKEPIKDEGEFLRLNNTLCEWRKAAKELDLTRKALVEPHSGAVKAINDFFRFLSVPLNNAVGEAKRCMVLYRQEEESRRRREAEAARVREEESWRA